MFAFEPEFYLITFASANHCIEVERRAKADFQVNIIPTPREITASCGMALRFNKRELWEVEGFFNQLDVPSQFFVFGYKGQNGQRPFERLADRE